MLSGAVLGAVAMVKLVAAVVPVAVAYGRLPGRRMWRFVFWIGGALLAFYGLLNTVVSAAVLAGAIRPEGGYDRAAMIGHAAVWEPFFLLWGVALLISLWVSRSGR